jgi:hypothetical protein
LAAHGLGNWPRGSGKWPHGYVGKFPHRQNAIYVWYRYHFAYVSLCLFYVGKMTLKPESRWQNQKYKTNRGERLCGLEYGTGLLKSSTKIIYNYIYIRYFTKYESKSKHCEPFKFPLYHFCSVALNCICAE